MKNSEIIDLSTKDLIEKIQTTKDELNKTKINHTVTPVENTMSIRATRKDIARMETELRKRQLTDKK